MMKQIIILFMLLVSIHTQAQQVYNELRQKAQSTVENAQANELVKQISQFKLDALNYMAIKMREEMPDSTVEFLDKQAMAMDNYVNFYVEKLIASTKLPNVEQVKMIKMFMDVSYSNPLFKDKDTEITLAYFNCGKCLTRFSLDTDWRKASAAIASLYQVK